MYKVFINQKPVIFTSSDQFDAELINKKNVLVLNGITFPKKQADLIVKGKLPYTFVVCASISKVWKDFIKKFTIIHAGGGLVLNNKSEMLFIFRKGKWDLPKGKLDRGEKISACALREVKEECGIKALKLGPPACTTYHMYTEKGKHIIKISSWFMMKHIKTEKLIPQIEEDITKLKFFSKNNYFRTVKKNTYPLIADLIESLPEKIY